MDSLTNISKIETADVAKLEEIRKLLTSVRIIAPEGALKKKVITSILVQLERQGICTYHAYSKIATGINVLLLRFALGESMYSRLREMWLQLV